jgi:hypothetical protein
MKTILIINIIICSISLLLFLSLGFYSDFINTLSWMPNYNNKKVRTLRLISHISFGIFIISLIFIIFIK